MNTLFMQNLMTGLIITFIGMVTVLLFLTIMIYAIDITKKIIEYINKFFPEVEEVVPTAKKKKKQEKADDEVAVSVLLASLQKGK